MNSTKKRIQKTLLLITLPLVMWLFFSQVAFWHYHLLDNGTVVEHAHPFKHNPQSGTPYQKHHHSDFEYSVLAQFSHAASLLLAMVVLGFVWHYQRKAVNEFYRSVRLSTVDYSQALLRAPPAIY